MQYFIYLTANTYLGSYKLFKNSKNIQDVDRNIGRAAFKYDFEEFEGIILGWSTVSWKIYINSESFEKNLHFKRF